MKHIDWQILTIVCQKMNHRVNYQVRQLLDTEGIGHSQITDTIAVDSQTSKEPVALKS